MNKPPLKQRLIAGETCTGTFLLFLTGGDVAQFLAGLGFDYFFLDMEHSSLDYGRLRETILAARACGIAPLVRVPEIRYHLVTRVLDAGAEGIMLPRVETPEQAADLVRFARYRPQGERGISTFAGHNDFAPIPDVPGFLARRNRDILLFVQIETKAGVERREQILSTPGIDGCFIGTGDLAMSLGYAGQPDHPAVLAEAEKVLTTARQKQLLTTIPIRTPEHVGRWVHSGITMLTLSTDGGLFSAGARTFLSAVQEASESPAHSQPGNAPPP
jgi:2-dehydro-3-deoxyglucarate aldolase/4-hydroxy-2-oxoheptanedioate aldolase